MQKFFANGEEVDEILGAVPEHTIRTMVEDILQRFPTDESGKLKALLNSWIQHNNQDKEKFTKWVEKAKSLQKDSIYHGVLQAAREIETANEKLAKLLIELQERE